MSLQTGGTYQQAKELIDNDLVREAIQRYRTWCDEHAKLSKSWKFSVPDYEGAEREKIHLVMTILEAAKMLEAYKVVQ